RRRRRLQREGRGAREAHRGLSGSRRCVQQGCRECPGAEGQLREGVREPALRRARPERHAEEEMSNPLLAPWTGPFGLPPFAEVRAEHFAPAFAAAMREHLAEIDAIAGAAAASTFENTIATFDRAGRVLGRIEALFYNLTSSETSPALQA